MSILDIFVIWSTVFLTSLKLDTSTTLYARFGLFISFTAFCNSFSSISQIIVFTPEFKNLFAISRPKPWAPPVIIAVLFLRSN